MILPDLVALAFLLLSVPTVSMAQSACALHGSDQTKTVEIRDPHFGERAYTLTIPADWKFEGTVLRAADGSRPELVYRATSPDGFMAVQRMPRYDWEWSDNTTYQKFLADSNLRPMKPMTAAEFVKRIVVPKARNGAQVGAAEPIPEVSKQVAEQDKEVNAKFAAMARQTGIPPSRVITSAERVRIRYQLGEKAEEEWIRTITSSLELPGRSISFAATGNRSKAQ